MHYVAKMRMRPAAVLLTPTDRSGREPARTGWAARLMLAMLGLTSPRGEAS